MLGAALIRSVYDHETRANSSIRARRSDRPTRATPLLDASVSADGRAQDRFKAKPDEVVQTPVTRLTRRIASRVTNVDAVRAAETAVTHGVIWKFAD